VCSLPFLCCCYFWRTAPHLLHRLFHLLVCHCILISYFSFIFFTIFICRLCVCVSVFAALCCEIKSIYKHFFPTEIINLLLYCANSNSINRLHTKIHASWHSEKYRSPLTEPPFLQYAKIATP